MGGTSSYVASLVAFRMAARIIVVCTWLSVQGFGFRLRVWVLD